MKKLISVLLILVLALSAVGCGSDSGSGDGEEKKQLPAAQEGTGDAAEEETHYKATMKAYGDIEHGKRIVVLQNAVSFGIEGLTGNAAAPETEPISYGGSEVQAYSMTCAVQYLTEGLGSKVTVYDVNGGSVEMDAADFEGMYAIIDDFQSGNPVDLYNPASGTAVEDFAYAVTEAGEGVYSIITEQDVFVPDLLASYGWDAAKTYHLVASDLFYIPITPEDYDEGGIRGTLSGSVNASFPEMVIAMGKINDVVFLEQVVE